MSRENLVLGEGVVLPDDVEVGANVVIHAGTVIGAGCVIQDNVVLGKSPKLASRSTAVPDLDESSDRASRLNARFRLRHDLAAMVRQGLRQADREERAGNILTDAARPARP